MDWGHPNLFGKRSACPFYDHSKEPTVTSDRPLFTSMSNQMNDTWKSCCDAPGGPGKTKALAHFRAAQTALALNDQTMCLEECRAAIEALV
ncbi:hypothetical protein ACSSV6_003824 [Roseovarius sp. MBR-38]